MTGIIYLILFFIIVAACCALGDDKSSGNTSSEKHKQSREIHTAAIQEVTMTITVNALPAEHHIMTATARSADTPTSTWDGSVRTTDSYFTRHHTIITLYSTHPQ